MADNDIYNSKFKYERFLSNLNVFAEKPPESSSGVKGRRKYYCKNRENLLYFRKLDTKFSAKDLSYPRRLRLFNTLKIITYISEKLLLDCNRDDIDEIVAFMHTVNKSIKTKQDFIIDIKYIWKTILPEKDERGRIDDTLVPYPVRHLSGKMDKSKEKRRDDKLMIEEFESLVKSFSQDVRLQAYITVEYESLGRPQEILFAKIKDVELYDNYGKIWISEHGKEGTGFLEVIDSYPYLVNWLNQHPLRHDPEAFLFINLGNIGRYKQLKPVTINKHIRDKLKVLGINKPITCYSLKRSGVTYRRLRGDSDAEIQHTARWTSTKQLKTYDLSNHDDTFKIALAKRGLISSDKFKQFQQSIKKCVFCETVNGIGDDMCKTCKRPLDRKKILKAEKSKEEELRSVRDEMTSLQNQLNTINTFMNKVVEKNPKVLEVLAKEEGG